MIQRFRKKPVEIEAVRFFRGNAEEVAAWCGGRYRRGQSKPSDPDDFPEWLDIPTLENVMKASLGDWVIRGVRGEFYPCKPDIFAETYEEVRA